MADFMTAFLITIDDAHEGGYQCIHDDSGNWTSGIVGEGELKGTKYGISAHEYPNEDIKNLTVERAAEIYREGYWKQNYDQIMEQLSANKLFDMGVLFGVHEAVKVLQSVVGLVSQDGIFGPGSLEAVNQAGVSVLANYKTALVAQAVQIIAAKPAKRPFFSRDWGPAHQ